MSKKKQNLDLAPSRRERFGVGQFFLSLIIFIYTVLCAMPIVIVFVAAFTDEKYIGKYGFGFFPAEVLEDGTKVLRFSMDGVKTVIKYGKLLYSAYGITILITVVGTVLGLFIMSMYAYAISRKGFVLSKFLSVFLLIPMLFNGGQLAGYIAFTRWYGMKDNLWLLILPLCVTTMNVIILRTYIVNSIPEELMEAARIDGAGKFRTFFQITLPLMKPTLAAVGFMMATSYWNDWQNALLYIDTAGKKPLQLLLINIQKSIEVLINNANVPSAARAAMGGTIPQYSSTMATVIVVIGPIMIAYPFFQKYFVKGLTVGSVKG